MSAAMVHIGPMYRKLGMDTDAGIIASRIAAANSAYEEMSGGELGPLVRTALGRGLDGDLGSLVEEVKKVDVTFDVSVGKRELVLMATAILQEAMQSDGLSDMVAVAVIAAAFGRLRMFEAEPSLLELAQRSLARQQDIGPPTVLPIKWTKRPILEDDQASLLSYSQQGNIAAAHPHLKKIIDSAPAYTERVYSALAQQVNVIASAHNRLAEQMGVHWWVMNGWSLEASVPFSELTAGEAVLRASVELARLTSCSKQGLLAAPALLSRLLTNSGFNPKESVRLNDVILSAPIDWRRIWTEGLDASSSHAVLLPVTLAVALAVETGDEADWEPRFERAAGVSAAADLSLLGLAHQLYLEILLRPHISQ